MSLPRKLTIDVTEDDIRHGKRCSFGLCPISLAAIRATGRAAVVSGPGLLIIQSHREETYRPYGGDVGGFIRKFDLCGEAEPQSFVFIKVRK
jgi:hypothetical protein